jgi:hypothetical protein
MGGDKREHFLVRTDKPIFKSCKRRKRWLLFAFAVAVAFTVAVAFAIAVAFTSVSWSTRLKHWIVCEVVILAAPFFPVVKCEGVFYSICHVLFAG